MRDLPRRAPTAVGYAVVVLVALLAPPEAFYALLAVVGALAGLELVHLRRAGIPAAIELAVLLGGLVALAWLRVHSETILRGLRLPSELLMTFVAVWAMDVVAYVVGSTFGRHRIVPRISPGKTWEGTVAGIGAALLVVALWERPFLRFPAWGYAAAILVGPAAFAGDLLESWTKRRAGVKDSGGLLPGHGGVLDRIDSLLATAVLVAAAIALIGPPPGPLR